MKKIKIGVLGPSEIAFRRFLPALIQDKRFEYVGVAIADEIEWFGNIVENRDLNVLSSEMLKAHNFVREYGGRIYTSYEELLTSNIDAIYIPLPPALHYKWAKKAIDLNKHVFVEKPSTHSNKMTNNLISLATSKNLALHENYMFIYHSQINYIMSQTSQESFGQIRLIRISFGFPFRGSNDFRYNKSLGGGALLDCGGYTVKLAQLLLGNSVKVDTATLNYDSNYDVDIYGSATLSNSSNTIAQISFGMDNTYKNELEIWGNKTCIFTNRVFTAPDNYNPIISIEKQGQKQIYELESDSSFVKSINHFYKCITDAETRCINYADIAKQSELIEEIIIKAGEKNENN